MQYKLGGFANDLHSQNCRFVCVLVAHPSLMLLTATCMLLLQSLKHGATDDAMHCFSCDAMSIRAVTVR